MKRILTLWLAAMLVAVQPCYAVVMVGFGQDCGTFSFVGAPGEVETFENTEGDFCTIEFTETDASGYITTYSTAASHGGTHSAEFANTTTTGAFTHYIRSDIGATDDGYTLTWWFKTPNNVTVYSNLVIFSASTSTDATDVSSRNLIIAWDGNGPNGLLRFCIESISAGDTSATPLSYNAWYKFVLRFTNNGMSYLDVYNASNTLVETLEVTAKDKPVRYFYWFDDAALGENTYLDDVQYDSTNP